MSAAVVIPPGGGEVIGDAPDRRVEILSDHPALHATWSRFGPGREGADLHVHRRHTDVFYVLDGVFTLRLGVDGETVELPAGTLARMPPMVVHGFRNAGDADVRYLNLHAPGCGFADYLRALREGRTLVYDQEDPPAEGVRPASDAAVAEEPVVVERPGVRTRLLADVEEIAVAEVAVNPGTAAPAFDGDGLRSLYVLEGEHAGTWIQVPARAEHPLAGPLRFLEIHTPNGGYGEFVTGSSAATTR